MTLTRALVCSLSIASLATLTGCPGKSTQSNAAAHDVKYYNTHPQERQATLDRCDLLDKAATAADKDCAAALYSSIYGPSQLRTSASPR